MNPKSYADIFTAEKLAEIFPKSKSDDFFDALFGDPSEGAYDIELVYRQGREDSLLLELLLHERPGRCLACNLTQGLPQVFSRHPIINVKGIVSAVNELLGEGVRCAEWKLGYTQQHSRSLHGIPLAIRLEIA